MRYEIKPSHRVSPVFLTRYPEVLRGHLSYLYRLGGKYPVSWRLSTCAVSVTHIYAYMPASNRREKSGDVSSRLNLGEDVRFRDAEEQ